MHDEQVQESPQSTDRAFPLADGRPGSTPGIAEMCAEYRDFDVRARMRRWLLEAPRWKQMNRLANIAAIVCVIGGFMMLFRHPYAGVPLALTGIAIMLPKVWIVRRLEIRDKYESRYGSYEGFRSHAHEDVDYDRLFFIRDHKNDRAAARFLLRYVPGLQRPTAERFLSDLTEDDRPPNTDGAGGTAGGARDLHQRLRCMRAMVTGHQVESYGLAIMYYGAFPGIVLPHIVGFVGLLFFLCPPIGYTMATTGERMKRTETFSRHFRTYDEFAERASEVVDYERLFLVKDQGRSRRGMIRFMRVHVPGVPRAWAGRFLADVTEDDRPSPPPDGRPLSGYLPPGPGGQPASWMGQGAPE